MVKTAVILAAGLGSRLGLKDRPKGFLEIEGIPLVERSIRLLKKNGIERIIFGTGHMSEAYEALSRHYDGLSFRRNPLYASTGSMATLAAVSNDLDEPFLLLESDLLFENEALRSTATDSSENIMLGSNFTGSGDEVYIQADDSGLLQKVSKVKNELNHLSAELVGISKISPNCLKAMCDFYQKADNPKLDYESVMAAISPEIPVNVLKMNDLAWCEIDDSDHLKRALHFVYPLIKSRDALMIKRNILLNPGPATTTDTVKAAQLVPDICPREKEFGQLMRDIVEGLTEICATNEKYTTVLFAGSGTASVESALTSAVPPNGKVLIINNGSYGQRMCEMAKVYNMDYLEFKDSGITPLNMEEIDRIMTENRDLTHLCAVHCETTTGLLNDIDSLGETARKHNVEFIVDAMSSYSAVPLDMEKSGIHYLCASSNKNIQGMAGASFVIADLESLKKLKNVPARCHYLDLFNQYSHFEKTGQTRFTPPVQVLYALYQALQETIAEGVENRFQRYTESWKTLTLGIKRLGLTYLIPDEYHSHIITSILIPEGMDFDRLHDYMFDRGYTIYPGKVAAHNTFRLSNIGNIDKTDIENFLKLLEIYLQEEL